MEPELWMWVYDGIAHGYYDTAGDAEAAMHEALHWQRQVDALIVKVAVDVKVSA